jgi:hypothetical protein
VQVVGCNGCDGLLEFCEGRAVNVMVVMVCWSFVRVER